MTLKDQFLKTFSELERVLHIESNEFHYEPFMKNLRESKNPVVKMKKNQNLLRVAADLRNLIVHNKDLDIAIPSDHFYNMFKDLVKAIKHPIQVKDIMLKKSDLAYCTPHQTLNKATDLMFKYHYSNIPILDKDKVAGIFTESSLLFMMEGIPGELVIDLNKEIFNHHLKRLHPEKHPSLRYPFISRKTPIYDAIDYFMKPPTQNGKRTELLLITNNGLSHEPLQGILSAYDLLDSFDD